MFLCFYVCMYVCMHVRTYACMDGWTEGGREGWLDRHTPTLNPKPLNPTGSISLCNENKAETGTRRMMACGLLLAAEKGNYLEVHG